MAQGNTDDIVARFPGPVTLRPSRTKWVFVFLGSAAFAIGGVFMIREGAEGGWLVAVFFGFCALTAMVIMLPGASSLRLSRERFEVTGIFHPSATLWLDATNFEVASVPPARQKMVVFDDAKAQGKTLARVNVGLTGRNAALPDTYGMTAEELASVMARWRERAAAAG